MLPLIFVPVASAAAFGMPELSVAIYPDAGYQRIVEITFTYAEPVEALRLKSAQLQEAAREVAQPAVSRNFRGRLLLSALFGALLDHRAALEAAAPEESGSLVQYKRCALFVARY